MFENIKRQLDDSKKCLLSNLLTNTFDSCGKKQKRMHLIEYQSMPWK